MSHHRLKNKILHMSSLWLKWKKIINTGSGLVELSDIELTGPVLSDCLKLEINGYLLLDLTLHFIIIIPEPYIVKLEWEGLVSQTENEVKIKKIILHDGKLGLLNKLKKKDKILIDCAGHHTDDENRGKYRTTYTSILFNEFGEPYDFD